MRPNWTPLSNKSDETAEDATSDLAVRLRRLLRWCIGRQAGRRSVRLVDKSQVFTVKVSFLQALLHDCHPIFVLVTRDPYASCQRAATRILRRTVLSTSALAWPPSTGATR